MNASMEVFEPSNEYRLDHEAYRNLNVRIPTELYRRVRIFCVENEILMTDFTVASLKAHLEKRG